jgi:hypothetical protein
MTHDRDPTLQTLFADAEQDLAGEAFTAQVMSQTGKLKHRVVIGWICIGLVSALCAWLLATPLQETVHLLTQSLTVPLITLDEGWLAQTLSPINNITILLALGLIGLRMAYRRIFS